MSNNCILRKNSLHFIKFHNFIYDLQKRNLLRKCFTKVKKGSDTMLMLKENTGDLGIGFCFIMSAKEVDNV